MNILKFREYSLITNLDIASVFYDFKVYTCILNKKNENRVKASETKNDKFLISGQKIFWSCLKFIKNVLKLS